MSVSKRKSNKQKTGSASCYKRFHHVPANTIWRHGCPYHVSQKKTAFYLPRLCAVLCVRFPILYARLACCISRHIFIHLLWRDSRNKRETNMFYINNIALVYAVCCMLCVCELWSNDHHPWLHRLGGRWSSTHRLYAFWRSQSEQTVYMRENSDIYIICNIISSSPSCMCDI